MVYFNSKYSMIFFENIFLYCFWRSYFAKDKDDKEIVG